MNEQILQETFLHARLKVNRAYRHIHEAQHWFSEYAKSDFCRIIDDTDPQSGKQFIRAVAEPVPANLVLSIGDAFHCMSAALDYIMSGLMRAKTGSASRIGFPTDESRDGLRKSFMPPKPGKKAPPNRRIVKAFPLIVLELFTRIKPYKRGDFAVWEVRKADNVDKHNLIIPSVTIAELRGVCLVDEVNNVRFENTTLGVDAGGVCNAIGYSNAGHRLKVTNKGQATASIRFPEDAEVFAGDPVFPTLLKCCQLIAEVIDKIEPIARRYVTARPQ